MALHDPLRSTTERHDPAAVSARCVALLDAPTVPLWTHTPAAQAALRACVEAGIDAVRHVDTYALTRDERWVYEGMEADAVKAVMDAFFEDRVFVLPREEALALYAAQPDMTDAIDAAFEWAEAIPVSMPALRIITTPVRLLDPAIWGPLS